MRRRLAAIFVADLVGYSRLMGADETGTLARYAALRRELIDPEIVARGGRIFKSMGDALLVEFSSVVEAVTCAMELARRMPGGEDALQFRFGIHVGDVMDEDGDLFGDAVNIAARIESAAPPGGIVLSEDAARYARGKVAAELTDIGARELKNIAEPVRLFAVGASPPAAPRGEPTASNGDAGRMPSLALTPLRHLGDPAQSFLTEGMSDGLSSALALFQWFDLVENTTGQTHPDFILDGSVQIAGPRARITVQLSEQATGRRVWGTTYDRSTDDPFMMQDELIATIACTLGEAIPEEAAHALTARPVETWTACDHTVDAMQKMHRLDPEGCRLSREALQRALAVAPGLEPARLVLGWVGFIETRWAPDRDAKFDEAIAIVRELVRENERNSGAWRLMSRLYLQAGQPDEALTHARRAAEINPYDSDIIVTEGMTLIRSGKSGEGVPLIEKAIRINPYAPSYYQAELALGLLFSGNPGAALEALQKLSRPVMHSRLTHAVTLVELGRLDEAQAQIRQQLIDFPEATVAGTSPVLPGPDAEQFAVALEKAGLPPG